MTKKIVLGVSLIGTLFIAGMIFIPSVDYCYSHLWCEQVLDWFDLISFDLFLFPIILFFSLITYRMRDEVFLAWLKHAKWYIPIYIILSIIFINLPHNGGGFGIPDMSGLLYLVVLLILSLIFVIVSFRTIISKNGSLKKI